KRSKKRPSHRHGAKHACSTCCVTAAIGIFHASACGAFRFRSSTLKTVIRSSQKKPLPTLRICSARTDQISGLNVQRQSCCHQDSLIRAARTACSQKKWTSWMSGSIQDHLTKVYWLSAKICNTRLTFILKDLTNTVAGSTHR